MEAVTPPGKTRKRSKVRSAWISFTGRIVAEIIGAIATVSLGAIVLGGRYAPVQAAVTPAPTVLIPTPVRTQGETVIVLMPAGKDGQVDRQLASLLAETYEKSKAAAPELADARPQTPTDRPSPRSADPSADSRASLEFPRE